MFKEFNPAEFKQRVLDMPELLAVLECNDVDKAAPLLTQGLTRILDSMAPVRTIQTRKEDAPHMGGRNKGAPRPKELCPGEGSPDREPGGLEELQVSQEPDYRQPQEGPSDLQEGVPVQ